ncbi:MAG: NAD(P)(+) transhydrogenase (Re/Si-specific) subunit beta, partial [Rhodocyclaceae bacterium]|nr:NAD(P)(+) transhydrogenase (Re/Si-specific) subunit beta [Rhodocyclaceae bacterium]
MSQGLVMAAYIVAALFFIISLVGLSKQETARYGNLFGMIGMGLALVASIGSVQPNGWVYIFVAMAIGSGIGAFFARKVEMTQMPELVAILHSFVGLAAVLVGLNSYADSGQHVLDPAMHTVHLVEVFLGVFIGAVTFTGSVVA